MVSVLPMDRLISKLPLRQRSSSMSAFSVFAEASLTGAGATFPYGVDPLDRNLRIAPTYPTDDEVKQATEILVLTVKLAALEYYIA